MVRQGGLGVRGRAARAAQRVALSFLLSAGAIAHAGPSPCLARVPKPSAAHPRGDGSDHDASAAILAEMMRSGSATGSPRLILSTFPMPSVTWPQTVYLPLRKGASAKQMQNWLSPESGDCARAIDTVPRRCGSLLNSALSFLPEPPVPVPWGQPVCAMKPSMTR